MVLLEREVVLVKMAMQVLMARWDPQEGPVNSENQDPQVTMVHPAKWAHRDQTVMMVPPAKPERWVK